MPSREAAKSTTHIHIAYIAWLSRIRRKDILRPCPRGRLSVSYLQKVKRQNARPGTKALSKFKANFWLVTKGSFGRTHRPWKKRTFVKKSSPSANCKPKETAISESPYNRVK